MMPFTTLISSLQTVLDDKVAPYIKSKRIALLDFPDHSNVGDSAIWLGEIAFFRRHLAQIAVTSSAVKFKEDVVRSAHPEGTIVLHGGGSFGDIHPHLHAARLDVIERFPDREIIQMPQSIYFRAARGIGPTARIISEHGRFKLFVRDEPSLLFAQNHFDCAVELVPDMAFALGSLARPHRARQELIYLLRRDREKKEDYLKELHSDETGVDWMDESRLLMRLSSAVALAEEPLASPVERLTRRFNKHAERRVMRGLNLLSRGRAIITDRLHAHILSILLGTPNAVLDNNYGKITAFHDKWTTGHPLVLRASSIVNAREWAREMSKSIADS